MSSGEVRRFFIKVANDAALHAKFQRVGPYTFGWWVAALSWCDRHRTDGRIPPARLVEIWPGTPRRKLSAIVARLLQVRSLERHGGLLIIHDYLEWQQSRSAIESRTNGSSALYGTRVGRSPGRARRKLPQDYKTQDTRHETSRLTTRAGGQVDNSPVPKSTVAHATIASRVPSDIAVIVSRVLNTTAAQVHRDVAKLEREERGH